MIIRDETALRFAWEELKFWENENDPKAKEIIDREKKAIRKYNKNNKQINTIIKNNGDSMVCLTRLSNKVKSLEAAKRYFRDHYYRGCTGQIYTQWYKIIKRNGKYLVYHSIAMDI